MMFFNNHHLKIFFEFNFTPTGVPIFVGDKKEVCFQDLDIKIMPLALPDCFTGVLIDIYSDLLIESQQDNVLDVNLLLHYYNADRGVVLYLNPVGLTEMIFEDLNIPNKLTGTISAFEKIVKISGYKVSCISRISFMANI